MSRLVIVSKSPASPPIRREHALAALAVADGIEVVFVERARDVRAARRDPAGWLRALARAPSSAGPWGQLVSPAVVLPGHRGRLASGASERVLGHALRAVSRSDDVVVAMTPWDWPAVARVPGVRRVFDYADDWPGIIPGRRAHLQALVGRAGAEADEVVVASPKLREAFAPRPVALVRNAAGGECLAIAPTERPRASRAVYVGTLSERVDPALLEAALAQVPGLRIDLVGPCAYAGQGDTPAPELASLLARHPVRLAWHGPVDRTGVPATIDAADVGLLPFRPELARGDIMKVYDYTARGRPIVSAEGVVDAELGPVPGLLQARAPDAFSRAVETSLTTPNATLREARAWAESNDWAARWPAWRTLLLGST